ncbi:MAG: hypothetical protein AAF715_31705 [Myxococcota bacterium]
MPPGVPQQTEASYGARYPANGDPPRTWRRGAASMLRAQAADSTVGSGPSTSVLATAGRDAGRRAAVWWESTPLTKEELAQTHLVQEGPAQEEVGEEAGIGEKRAEPQPRGVVAGRTEP